MPWWAWLLVALAATAVVYAAFVVWLVVVGRREDARAVSTFIPDCIGLVSRLARDPRVPRARKLLLLALIGYLALTRRAVVAAVRSRGEHRRTHWAAALSLGHVDDARMLVSLLSALPAEQVPPYLQIQLARGHDPTGGHGNLAVDGH